MNPKSYLRGQLVKLNNGNIAQIATFVPEYTTRPKFHYMQYIPDWLYKLILKSEFLEDIIYSFQHHIIPSEKVMVSGTLILTDGEFISVHDCQPVDGFGNIK